MLKNDNYELFQNLVALPIDQGFKRTTVTVDGENYTIFDYNLIVDDKLWELPGALDSRGIMFEVDDNGEFIRLASRPQRKFFNLNENHLSKFDLYYEKMDYVLEKVDGSLISTYFNNRGELKLKSRGSCTSVQAQDAYKFLMTSQKPEVVRLRKALEFLGLSFTVNMEWCSPNNQVVVSFEEPTLIVHSLIHNQTGIELKYEIMASLLRGCSYVARYPIESEKDLMDKINHMQQEEGLVVKLENGQQFKLKCEWYVLRHRAKSYVTSDHHLWQAIANGSIDDIKPMFVNDPIITNRIKKFETQYFETKRKLVTKVSQIFDELKDKDRKDFAILSRERLGAIGLEFLFSVVMNRYIEREGIEQGVENKIRELKKLSENLNVLYYKD